MSFFFPGVSHGPAIWNSADEGLGSSQDPVVGFSAFAFHGRGKAGTAST